MKSRFLFQYVFGVLILLLFSVGRPAQGQHRVILGIPPEPVADLPPSLSNSDVTQTIGPVGHVLYDPFVYLDTLPEYPPTPMEGAGRPAASSQAKPEGIDLDVMYISRTPLYFKYDVTYTADGKPFLAPGSEDDPRWPAPGETVTFTAHVANKGTLASGAFGFIWLIDGVEVNSGTLGSLEPGAEATETYQWIWTHGIDGERLLGAHSVAFSVDPADLIPETYETNNVIEDRTDALSLIISLTPEMYASLEVPISAEWPFSAEDWLQKQFAALNAAFARSIYPAAPNGIEERVRLDRVLISASEPPADPTADGGFWISGDPRIVSGYYDAETDVDGSLLHELSHQLGIIDIYNFGFNLESVQVLDRLDRPLQMFVDNGMSGLMIHPGLHPPFCDEHSSLAMNVNKGYRRGYYGEYLYDIPSQIYLRLLDNEGQPASGVTIRLFQVSSEAAPYGGRGGTIDNIPEISVVTDASGLVLLDNREVGTVEPTRTGHTLTANPFGIVDVVANNDEFIIEITKGEHQEYSWLPITRFNLAAWTTGYASATFDIASHVPPEEAPGPPEGLEGRLESGLVELTWLRSTSPGIVAYNLYRSDGPEYYYRRIVTNTTAVAVTQPYDFDSNAITYAVTAVDAQGRESGFSDLFYAFRLNNPASIAIDAENRRVVLDPQNGYALLYQLPDGTYLDTRGSVDYHLEFSRYVACDLQGHLIISHPGDYYSMRHSVRVTDKDLNPLLEFGEQGSSPGQFDYPSGVAVWGRPCSFQGPYGLDEHTLLLLHFDGIYTGAQTEIGNAQGTSFVPGMYGQGVLITDTATLSYTTADNFLPEQGSVEFWVRPGWSGDEGAYLTFMEVGEPTPYPWASPNRLWMWMDYFWSGNKPKLSISNQERSVTAETWTPDWVAGEWYHVAGTWAQNDKVRFYVDGVLLGESGDTTPLMSPVWPDMFVGSSPWGDRQIRGVIDELRISDIQRVGNSDTCTYRILVADSGNNRIQAFDSEGHFVSSFGSEGSGTNQFNNPQGLTVDPGGRVIVVDQGNNRLQILSYDGETLNYADSYVAGFNTPTGIASDQWGNLVVADTGNNRVVVLSPEGQLLAEYSQPNDSYSGAFLQPGGAAVGFDGNIVVADTGNRRVVTILGALPAWFQADFSADPTMGFRPLSVTFTNTSGGSYDGCTWDFGDGTISSSCNNPMHTYLEPGVYTVTLTISGLGGEDKIAKADYITVWEKYCTYLPVIVRQFH